MFSSNIYRYKKINQPFYDLCLKATTDSIRKISDDREKNKNELSLIKSNDYVRISNQTNAQYNLVAGAIYFLSNSALIYYYKRD